MQINYNSTIYYGHHSRTYINIKINKWKNFKKLFIGPNNKIQLQNFEHRHLVRSLNVMSKTTLLALVQIRLSRPNHTTTSARTFHLINKYPIKKIKKYFKVKTTPTISSLIWPGSFCKTKIGKRKITDATKISESKNTVPKYWFWIA